MPQYIYRYGYRWFTYTGFEHWKEIPPLSGLYIIRVRDELTNRSTPVYIGCSSNFRSRIKSHLVWRVVRKRCNPHQSSHFLFTHLNLDKYSLGYEERALIKLLNPCFNRSGNKYQRNYQWFHNQRNLLFKPKNTSINA